VERTVIHSGFLQLEVVATPQGQRELVRTTDSLCLLIFDQLRNRLILVRQPRPSQMSELNPDSPLANREGLITECCAGRFDGRYSPLELAVKEAEEETGIQVNPENVELLNGGRPMAVSAGVITELSYLAYVRITSDTSGLDQKLHGRADEGEEIRLVSLDADPRYLQVYLGGACQDIRVFTLLQYHLNKMECQVS